MKARPIARALGDITTSEWHAVADQVVEDKLLVWSWHLSRDDRTELAMARDIGGTITTMQERTCEHGPMRLIARRIPVRTGLGTRYRPFQAIGRGVEAVRTEKPLASRPDPFLTAQMAGSGAFRPERRSSTVWHDDTARMRAKGQAGGVLGAAAALDDVETADSPVASLKSVGAVSE